MIQEKLKEAAVILDSAISKYKPNGVFALLSGGHDSLTATAVAYECLGSKIDAVVHIDTGIGIPQTQQFVIDVCAKNNWPLLIYRAAENTRADGSPDPQIYEDIVIKHGFPGPAAHRFMYSKLKQRQVRRLVRDHKEERFDKIMLISGVRKAESTRRMGNVKEVHVDGAQVWVSPMLNFTDDDQRHLMREWNLPRNPVKDNLCMSGECLCGAFAQKGELAEIKIFYPEVAARIESIQEKVKAAGHKKDWETGDFASDGDPETDNLMMCVRCEERHLSSQM
jgi:3'-phosphoadenosine 5'-phosphosulfate sulfotransferase (PAPS reductase)/FAD synthetase